MKEFEINVEGKAYKIGVENFDGKRGWVLVDGKRYEVSVSGMDFRPPPPSFGHRPYMTAPESGPSVRAIKSSRVEAPVVSASHQPVPAPSAGGPGTVTAPMPGLVIDIMVNVGDSVKSGAVVAKIEAMKMENEIPASSSGTVKSISVKKGDSVSTGETMLEIEGVE